MGEPGQQAAPRAAAEEANVQSVKDVIGKTIISIESGDKLGTVSDALMDDGSVSLVALVVGGGVLGKEHVLPFSDVHTLGGDTVLARADAGISGPREWRESGVQATRSSALKGRPVVTMTGHKLGEVSDLLVDPRSGAFAALEVAASDFGGLRTKRSLIKPGAEIRIGPDAVVVPDVPGEPTERDGGEPQASQPEHTDPVEAGPQPTAADDPPTVRYPNAG